jgi:hypothetical protein
MTTVKIRRVLMGNLLKATKWTGSNRRKDDRYGTNLAQFRVFVLDVLFLLVECSLWPVSDICMRRATDFYSKTGRRIYVGGVSVGGKMLKYIFKSMA